MPFSAKLFHPIFRFIFKMKFRAMFQFPKFIFVFIFLVISADLSKTNSRKILENGENSSKEDSQNAETAAIVPTAKIGGCCTIYENGQLFALMERICELCQDMIGQNWPNMREECSADCFRSSTFKKCLRLFKPIIGGSSSLRRANRILKQMAETFAESQQHQLPQQNNNSNAVTMNE